MPVKLEKNADGRWFATGAIDELADFEPLNGDQAPVVGLDLRGVRSMNSHGIRGWTLFLQGFRGNAIEFYACPSLFLDAVDLIPKVLPAPAGLKSIKSCWIEYFCDHCEKQVGFEHARTDVNHANFDRLNNIKCPRCRNVMHANGNLDIYCDLLNGT